MITIIRQMVAVDGSMSGALEGMLHRGNALAGWSGVRAGRPGPLADVRAQPPSASEVEQL
jgi:hypothetical protein